MACGGVVATIRVTIFRKIAATTREANEWDATGVKLTFDFLDVLLGVYATLLFVITFRPIQNHQSSAIGDVRIKATEDPGSGNVRNSRVDHLSVNAMLTEQFFELGGKC